MLAGDGRSLQIDVTGGLQGYSGPGRPKSRESDAAAPIVLSAASLRHLLAVSGEDRLLNAAPYALVPSGDTIKTLCHATGRRGL